MENSPRGAFPRAGRIPWEELLDDLFGFVLKNLEGREVCHVQGVCSNWKGKARRLLDTVRFDIGNRTSISELVRLFPALREVRLVFQRQEPELRNLQDLSALSHLTKLVLENTRPSRHAATVDLGVLRECRHIVRLSLTGVRFTAASGVQQLTQLQELEFTNCRIEANDPPFGRILQPLRKLTHLQVDRCSPQSRINLRGLSLLSGVESLVLRFAGAGCDDLALELGKMESLKHLDVNLSHCATLNSFSEFGINAVANLRSVVDLNLGGHCMISNWGVEHISRLSTLTALDISGPGPLPEVLMDELHLQHLHVSDAGLCHLLPLTQLRSLTLSYTMITNSLLRKFLHTFRNLQHLSVSHCSHVSDTSLFATLSCPNLTSLDVSFCMQVSDLGLLGVSRSAKQLQGLNLSGCHRVTDVGLEQLCKLRGLRWLSLAYCGGITDVGIRLVVCNMPLLGYLSIKDCSNITDEGVAWVGENLTWLTELDVAYCHQVTDASILLFGQLKYIKHMSIAGTSVSNHACNLLRARGIHLSLTNDNWWME